MTNSATIQGPRYVSYLRVSTREQGDSGLGLDAQRASIRAEAKQRGWTIVEEFVDAGQSGKSLAGRTGLGHALALVGRDGVEGLVAAKLDRLSRSVLDFAGLMARAKREGWNLVALDLGIDLSTPSGRLMANVMASFAEHERDLIGQRTSDALQVLQLQGVQLGRPSVVPVPVIARIVDLHRAGWSSARIARALDEDGVPTAHGGRRWWPATVRAVLRSQAARSVVTS
jgi:DNA invertase Pin-like site-specific DNA recombinase